MIVLNFEVIKQTVSQKNFEKLVNDSSNYVKLCFDFKDPDWSDVCKRILFHSRSSETYCKELDENHEVIVPWEVLTDDYFVFNLYGVGEDSLRITTTPKRVSLGNSDYTDEIEKPLPPTPSVLDDIYNRIDNADSSISVMGESVEGLEATVSGHTSSIDGLVSDVSGLGDSVDTLEDTVSRHTGSISNLTGTVNNHSNVIGNHERLINSLSNTLEDVSDDVDSLETVVNGHTNSINSLTGSVSALSTTVNAVSDTVDGLESTVNDHSDMISRHEGGISNLENDFANFREYYDQKINNTIEMTVEYTDGTSETFDVVVK